MNIVNVLACPDVLINATFSVIGQIFDAFHILAKRISAPKRYSDYDSEKQYFLLVILSIDVEDNSCSRKA
jgi:hypothetical protein